MTIRPLASIILTLSLFTLLVGCGMKVYKLKDGVSEVPSKPEEYQNKIKFDKLLVNFFDTTVVYEEFDEYNNKLSRLNINEPRTHYSVYRFYSNGCFSIFILNRNDSLEMDSFNPEYTGYRGIYYLEKGQPVYEEFVPADEMRTVGRIKGKFTFRGDTLVAKRKGPSNVYPTILVKRKVPAKYLEYKANW